MIISIGVQCTIASLKKDILKISSPTYPFDWMLTSPKFVFEMLELLLDKRMDISELVRNHFFICDKRATFIRCEDHVSNDDGKCLYNTKYNVIFPHDTYSETTIAKYIRRFERLKDIILTSTDELRFVYCSQSSLDSGNFTVDGKEVIFDVYYYLSKIYELIGKHRINYKMIVFDAVNVDDSKSLNENISLILINKCNNIGQLLNQLHDFKSNMID